MAFLVHSASGAVGQHYSPARADGAPAGSAYGLPYPLVPTMAAECPAFAFLLNWSGVFWLTSGFFPCSYPQSYVAPRCFRS